MKIKTIINVMGSLCLAVALAGCCGGSQDISAGAAETVIGDSNAGDVSGQAAAVRVEESTSKERSSGDIVNASGDKSEMDTATETSGRDTAGNGNGTSASGSQPAAGNGISNSAGGNNGSNPSGGGGASNSSGGSNAGVSGGGGSGSGGSGAGVSGGGGSDHSGNSGSNTGTSSGQPPVETSCSHQWDSGYIAALSDCERGGSRVYSCVKCGAQKSQPLAPLGHTVVIDYGYPPSCTSLGLSEGSHCSRCGKVFAAQLDLEMTDHDWTVESVWVSGYLTCYCGQVFYDADSYFAHFDQQEVAAEHGCVSTPGYEKNIYTCSMCGRTLNAD